MKPLLMTIWKQYLLLLMGLLLGIAWREIGQLFYERFNETRDLWRNR